MSYIILVNRLTVCLDKEAIMLAQVHACERLLDLSRDQIDTAVLEKEISKLKLAIEMMKS